MFDGLLGSKFPNKCKGKLKCIKMRIGAVKSKKEAIVRIQRNDIANLIASSHQHKAFQRIDALNTDMNTVTCYEMIEQFCDLIQGQIPIMHKQRECPDELAEAVSNLIYAAARFPDLPELCDLRHLFIERYGSNVESCVDSEFMKKVQKRQLSRQEKLQIMQEIANEHSVRWSIKEFDDQKPNHDETKKKSVSAQTKTEEPSPVLKREVQSMLKGAPDATNVANRHQVQVQRGVHVVSSIEKEQLNTVRENSAAKEDKLNADISIKKPKSCSNDKPVNWVPPYTKQNASRDRNQVEQTSGRSEEKNVRLVLHNKGKAANMLPPYVKPTHNDLKDGSNRKEEWMESDEDEEDNGIFYGKLLSRISSEQRRQGRFHSRAASRDEEDEKAIDRLLVHYSKKGTIREHNKDRTTSSVNKVTIRATSLQADTDLHREIPDFDQLAARVAAIKKLLI